MNELLQFLGRHGPSVLFVTVFIEQLGVPIPAAPWLLAAGALAASGQIRWGTVILAGTIGSLVADAIWFYIGRYAGNRALGLLCRISLEPDSCVRKTQDIFRKYGIRGIILAKFIPGLSTLAPPLAGSSGISALRFFSLDGLASLLYVGGLVAVGIVFSHELEKILAALGSLGGSAMGIVAAGLALYLAYKYLQRRKVLAELRMARITVEELQQQLEAGETPLILDVRPLSEIEREPMLIRGARHISLSQVDTLNLEVSASREVVLYCDCPNEVSAAKAALVLRRKGISRVRPLLGGIEAWRKKNFPMDTKLPSEAATTEASVPLEKAQ